MGDTKMGHGDIKMGEPQFGVWGPDGGIRGPKDGGPMVEPRCRPPKNPPGPPSPM